MANASDLMGLGMGPGQAGLVGDTPCGGPTTGIISSGTTKSNAVALAGTIGLVNPTTANATYTLWSGVPISGDVRLHNNSGTNAAVIYPPVGHALNGTTNGSLTIAAGHGVLAFRQATTDWRTILSA